MAEAQIRIRRQLQLSLLNREDIMYETVFLHPSKLTLIRQARELGYFVRLFFICTAPPESILIVWLSVSPRGGHTVPGDKVSSRYNRALMYGADALRLVQRGYVYDNSKSAKETEKSFELLFRTTDGNALKLYSSPDTWPQAYRYFLQDVEAPGD